MNTAVKFVDGSDDLIEGLAIPFGGPFNGKDIDGEDFGPDTDFAFDLFPHGRPTLYDHGTDPAMKATVQGRQTEYEVRPDEGVWAKVQLDKAAKYHATVKRMIDQGLLFFSSGSAPQMAAKNADGHITRWPWLELSLTPTPANTLAKPYAVKMADFVDHAQAVGVDLSAAAVKAVLAALDERGDEDSGSESFDDQGTRVVSEVGSYLERAETRYAQRATKVGRELSGTNREWLQSLDERLGALAELRKEVQTLLAKTDPDAAKSAVLAVIEAEATLARSLGVPIPN